MRARRLTVIFVALFWLAATFRVNAQSTTTTQSTTTKHPAKVKHATTSADSLVTPVTAVYLGIKGGLGVPNLSAGGGNPVSSGYSSIEGPYFGIFSEFGITHHFAIQLELNYSEQGGKKNGEQAVPSAEFAPPGTPGLPEYFYANFDSKAHLNYLELPILAKFSWPLGKQLKFLVDAGPYLGYLLSAKNITSGNSYVYEDQGETTPVSPSESFDTSESITNQIHHFNFGIQGGIGLEYFVKHCGYFYLQIGGNYGFMNIQKGTINGKNETGAATAALGWAFNLTKPVPKPKAKKY